MNERVTESLTWRLALGRRGADRERKLQTPRGSGRREGSRFAERSSFESCSASVSACSSSRNCSRSGPSTASVRAFSRIAREARPDLHRPDDVVLGRVHRDLGRVLGDERVHRRAPPRGARPRRSRREPRRRASLSSSAVSSVSTHFGLPTCERRSSSTSQILRISACASSSASRSVSSGIWSAPASTIVSASLRADDDEVERRAPRAPPGTG